MISQPRYALCAVSGKKQGELAAVMATAAATNVCNRESLHFYSYCQSLLVSVGVDMLMRQVSCNCLFACLVLGICKTSPYPLHLLLLFGMPFMYQFALTWQFQLFKQPMRYFGILRIFGNLDIVDSCVCLCVCVFFMLISVVVASKRSCSFVCLQFETPDSK